MTNPAIGQRGLSHISFFHINCHAEPNLDREAFVPPGQVRALSFLSARTGTSKRTAKSFRE
jgi:hypothetical protein